MSAPRHLAPKGRARPQRGATLVEYALLAALFLTAMTVGLNIVFAAGRSALSDSATDIGSGPPSTDNNSYYSQSGSGSTVAPTTIAVTTTTAAATTSSSTSTTIATTTTTRAPTTTTTLAPTTTTIARTGSKFSGSPTFVVAPSCNGKSGGTYNASVSFTVVDNLGNPVSGATVSFNATLKGTNAGTTANTSGASNASGVATYGPISLSCGTTDVSVTTTGVTASGLTFNGQNVTASQPRP